MVHATADVLVDNTFYVSRIEDVSALSSLGEEDVTYVRKCRPLKPRAIRRAESLFSPNEHFLGQEALDGTPKDKLPKSFMELTR